TRHERRALPSVAEAGQVDVDLRRDREVHDDVGDLAAGRVAQLEGHRHGRGVEDEDDVVPGHDEVEGRMDLDRQLNGHGVEALTRDVDRDCGRAERGGDDVDVEAQLGR